MLLGLRATQCPFPSLHTSPGRLHRPRVGKCGLWRPSLKQGHRLYTYSPPATVQPDVERIEEAAADDAEDGGERFNWCTHWYPILSIGHADPTTPYAFTLLGKELVLWRDGEGEWGCLEDKCSHRQVPLSRGRFDKQDGNIMCSFHGWSFSREGKCTSIPQLDAERQESVCRGSRSRVQSYPVMEKHGLIWVWPDDSPTAWVTAPMTGAGVPEEFDDFDASNISILESNFSYLSMVEMSFDPTHAPFTHEGTMFQANPAQAIPCNMECLDFGPHGFKVSTPGYMKHTATSEGFKQFVPPALVITDYSMPTGERFTMLLFFVPSSPGKCRVLSAVPKTGSVGMFAPQRGRWGVFDIKQWLSAVKNIPQWLAKTLLPPSLIIAFQHSTVNELAFANQDNFLLSAIEKVSMGKEHEWRKNYYLPARADLALSTFRQWLDKYSGGLVQWAPGTQAASPVGLDEAFERWNYHTKHCIHCRTAVKLLIKWRGMVQKIGRLSLGASVVALVLSSRVPLCCGILGLAFAVACMFACQWLEWRTSFFYTSIPPGNQPGNVDLVYRETTA